MSSSRPPSGMVFFPNNGGESEKSAASSNSKHMMKEKMARQRQLSLDRQRNAAKSTFVGVHAQELPIHQDNSYDRASNMPRVNLKGPNVAAPSVQNNETLVVGANVSEQRIASPVENAKQSMGDASQLPRCQTANSDFSSVELLSNDGDGRPGFERCGGRATAEQQQGGANNADAWDLSMAREPTVAASGGKEEPGNSKRWRKPNIFGGNRAHSEGPGAGLPRGSNDIAVEQVASFDRSNVRTPDSEDRTFHGPGRNRRAPLAHGSPPMGRPPVPQPQRNSVAVQQMPGAIFDMDAPPSEAASANPVPPRPTSGGSAAARASSVPPRQAERQNSPLRLPSPTRVAGVAMTSISSLVASAPSPRFNRKATSEITEVSSFGAESDSASQALNGNIGYAASGGDVLPKAPAREASPSPVLGCAAPGAEKRGGRRGWRLWGGTKDAIANSEAPKSEPVKEVNGDVMPFSLDD